MLLEQLVRGIYHGVAAVAHAATYDQNGLVCDVFDYDAGEEARTDKGARPLHVALSFPLCRPSLQGFVMAEGSMELFSFLKAAGVRVKLVGGVPWRAACLSKQLAESPSRSPLAPDAGPGLRRAPCGL